MIGVPSLLFGCIDDAFEALLKFSSSLPIPPISAQLFALPSRSSHHNSTHSIPLLTQSNIDHPVDQLRLPNQLLQTPRTRRKGQKKTHPLLDILGYVSLDGVGYSKIGEGGDGTEGRTRSERRVQVGLRGWGIALSLSVRRVENLGGSGLIG